MWNWNFVALKFQSVFCLQMERKKRETLYINAAQFLPMVTGWNYPIKTISTDNVLKWWNRAKTGCNFLQKTILLKIKYLSVLFTYYKSEYFCLFCKWLIFNLICIFFWKMEGRVCLRLRIPYALSTLKNGDRFFLWLVLGLLTAFWGEIRYNYCFWLEEGCAGLFWARSGCFP